MSILRSFVRAPSAIVGIAVLGLLFVVAVVAPEALSARAAALDIPHANAVASADHLLGTDRLGRDLFLRVLVATRISMTLAVLAAVVGALIGYTLGIVAAVLPRAARSIALRAIDTALAFPGIIVAIFVSAIVGPGAVGAALGVGIALSFSFARVSSALSMSVGGRDYVLAARILGIGAPALMARYVLPNVAEPLIIQSTVAISTSIVQVSSLSFLGLGVQPPDFDWGTMLTEGVRAFYINPAAALGPAVAIALSALAFGFSGEALARAMNPALWTRPVRARNDADVAPVAFTTTAARTSAAASPRAHVALDVRDLRVTFPGSGGPVRVVDGVTFSVRRGEMVGIVGESGSGKTMTALGIARLTPYPGAVTGSVTIDGRDLDTLPGSERARFLGLRLAVVFQDPMSSLNPALTIGTQLTEGARIHRRLGRRAARALAIERLREVNIGAAEAQLDRRPHELSGGMRQRVMIAMGLMNEPAVLIADEPTTALDVTIQAQIMELLARINREHGTAVVLISHNIGLVSQNCAHVIVMYGGRIVEDAPTERLMSAPRHPYTRLLLAAVPDMSRPRDEALATIPGQPPDPAALPRGCAFAARCPLVMERCRMEPPPLETLTDGRRVACWAVHDDAA